jgi:hypothetical protein
MNRQEIIYGLKEYFTIGELVCLDTNRIHGEKSWKFFRTEFLETLLVLRRDIFKVPMACNYGDFTQRGLRCNLCQIVKDKTKENKSYLSAHVLGCGGDFTVQGMTAEEARIKIMENIDLLPYPIRLEQGVSWLHIDTYDDGQEKYSLFKA